MGARMFCGGLCWRGMLSLACVAAGLAAVGCEMAASGVTVSGKVAYRGMAIEGAEISVFQVRGGSSRGVASTRSGYHGSWVLRLSPGTYRLEATALLPRAGEAPLSLVGALPGVRVTRGVSRLDRLLIPLSPREFPPWP